MVDTQLSTLRDYDGRACPTFPFKEYSCSFCEVDLLLYDVVIDIDTPFYKLYDGPFARVLHSFLVKDIERCRMMSDAFGTLRFGPL